MAHPDLPAEQAHVDRAYARLEEMRATASASLRAAFGERGGTFQSFTERDIRVRDSLSRLEQLDVGDESLVFGRIDRHRPVLPGDSPVPQAEAADHPLASEHSLQSEHLGVSGTEAFHIGRIGVSGRDQEPLVVDWRAPVAEPFYRATGAQAMGLVRRRHFLTQGRRVLDLEDELFEVEGDASGRSLGLSGPQVLLSALARSRTGRMHDIVSTVQREQDEVIRAPMAGILVVQGGPGTGKTAVALHRAAYLLYTHRFPLESQGVLVVGPNPTFLRYIEHVLPSLGESGVAQSTVAGLYAGVRPSGKDTTEVAALKGDPRMARVVANAVATRQRALARTATIPYGSTTLRLRPEASAQIVSSARRRPGTHNDRRRLVEGLVWRHLAAEIGAARAGRATRGATDATSVGGATDPTEVTGAAGGIGATGRAPLGGEALPAGELSYAEVGQELRRVPEVVAALDRMWPVLTPEELLHDLFGAPPLMAAASRGVLSAEQGALLWRARSDRVDSVHWSDSDLPLLDEARALLGPPRRRRSLGQTYEPRAFGHIIVDEAQDLTPMQLRMLARRSISGSITMVGDLAQATGAWAPSGWDQVIAQLPLRRDWSLSELTVNYRTPSEIMELAARVLEVIDAGMKLPESVRSTGEPASFRHVERDAVGSCAATCVGELMAGSREAPSGTAAVIAPPSLLETVASELGEHRLAFATVGGAVLDSPVSVLAVEDAKGLEFDTVVVVEPAQIARQSAQGERALYVALTRATRHLAVVYAEDLPAAMDAGRRRLRS